MIPESTSKNNNKKTGFPKNNRKIQRIETLKKEKNNNMLVRPRN